jgi:MSHA biogenesis protein MshP
MSPKQNQRAFRQRGVGLPLAIFIITVLALIVVTITQLQQGTAEMEIQDLQSTRAFYAAESGAQAALALLFPLDGSAGASCSTPIYTNTFSVQGLNGCNVSVSCQSDNLGPTTFYTLTSQGTCGSGLGQGRRIVEVRAQ